jgi:hypothetical protein
MGSAEAAAGFDFEKAIALPAGRIQPHLLPVAHTVRRLLDRYKARDEWRENVRHYLEDRVHSDALGSRLVPLPVDASLVEKYTVLAAIHDEAEDEPACILRWGDCAKVEYGVYGAVRSLVIDIPAEHVGILRDWLGDVEADLQRLLPGAKGSAKRAGRGRRPSANTAYIDLLRKIPDAAGWTAARVGREIHRSASTVVETLTWKSLALSREKAKVERAKAQRRKPKASDIRRSETE